MGEMEKSNCPLLDREREHLLGVGTVLKLSGISLG